MIRHPRSVALRTVAVALATATAALAPAGPASGPGHAREPFTEGYRLVDTWTARPPSAGVPHFELPLGVDVSPDGLVYAVDRDRHAVIVLDAAGRVGGGWPADGATGALRDVAVSTERVLVLGAGRGEVRARDGALLTTVDLPGATGVAMGPDGRAYVVRRTGADLQSDTVIDILDRDGRTVDSWSSQPFVIVAPRGMAVASDGRVFLAADGAVYVFIDGAISGGLRLPEGTPEGEVHDVAVDREGRLFAVQGGATRRLVVWETAAGRALGVTSLAGATAVAAGPAGGLVVTTNELGGFVGISHFADRTDLGAAPRQWGAANRSLGTLRGPRRLAPAGADGVFIVDSQHRVQRWTADGQPLDIWEPDAASYVVDVMGGAETPCLATARAVSCPDGAGTAPWTVVPAMDSWLSAADGSAERLLAVDVAEQRVWLLGRDGSRAGSFELAPAAGFVVAPDAALDGESVFLADRDSGGIRVMDLAGTPRSPATIELPDEVVRLAARDGYVYALTGGGWVWKLDAGGVAQTAWQPAPDGSPEDLAVGPGGRVYVADPVHDRILVFEADAPPPPVPEPPDAARCDVRVDKRALPAEVTVGDTVRVTLSVRGACPTGDGRIDIVLVVDQSGSMSGLPLASAQAAAVAFLGRLTPGRAQVALVGFSTTATVHQPLTDDLRSVVRAVARMTAGGQTVYTEAMMAALVELTGPRSRPDVPQVVVLLTDGKPTDRTQVLRAAAEIKGFGITVYTIGLGAGVDVELLGQIASAPELYFDAPTESDLAAVYASIARRIVAGQLLVSGVVTDALPDDMRLVPGSAVPPAAVSGRSLRWDLDDVPTTGAVLSFEVQPRRAGLRPTNETATLAYVDSAGQSGQLAFPVPMVNVLPKLRWEQYLPLVFRNRCKPQRADVVLVFDTSSSMTGPAAPGSGRTKLEAALQAGRAFLNAMEFPGDQAALVTFDTDARRVQSLTGSRAELELSLAGIRAGRGTRIDRGLELAMVELLSARHRARNNPVIILLSDGLPEPGTERRSLQMALDARAAGMALFTIGLGEDADPDLLWLLAGAADRTFTAPDAEQLHAIYRQIAGRVLCD